MNLDDCYRRIEDIPDQELKDLIGKQRENQHIDFKLKYDRRDPKNQEQYKWEICKDVTLVILHIPPSDYIPHGFRSQGSINFVKRYGADTREYPMTDLGRDLPARHVPPIIHEINEKLDTINRNILQIGER